MDLSVFFAGTAGSVPSARRGLTATLIRRGGDALLFDCGEGTQRQLVTSVGLADLDAIFLTHSHVDHWLGLPGLLKTFDLRDRDKPLDLHGPPGLLDLLRLMKPVYGRLGYELRVHELETGEAFAGDGYRVAPFPVRHRGVRGGRRGCARGRRPRPRGDVLAGGGRPGRQDTPLDRRPGGGDRAAG